MNALGSMYGTISARITYSLLCPYRKAGTQKKYREDTDAHLKVLASCPSCKEVIFHNIRDRFIDLEKEPYE
jgi:hypothetical protein